MEDLYDKDRDRWQRVFRYPLYLRFLWILAIAAIVGAILGRNAIREMSEDQPLRGYAAIAVIVLFCLFCLWTSVRAWLSFIIASPTSIKISVLVQGRQRISWDNVAKVAYRSRLLGHALILVGTDGARVSFRSSISNYAKLVEVIRENAPDKIRNQLDDLLGEEEEEEEPAREQAAQQPPEQAQEPQEEQPKDEPEEEPDEQPQEQAPPAQAAEQDGQGEYHDG